MESDSDTSAGEQQEYDNEPDSPEPESMDEEHSSQPGPSTESDRPRRYGILPARFRGDEDDGVVCELCQLREPPGLAGDTIFWVDCDLCGACGCTTTVHSRRMLFLEDTNVISVHLNFFVFFPVYF